MLLDGFCSNIEVPKTPAEEALSYADWNWNDPRGGCGAAGAALGSAVGKLHPVVGPPPEVLGGSPAASGTRENPAPASDVEVVLSRLIPMNPMAQASLMRLSMGRPGTEKGNAAADLLAVADGKLPLGAAWLLLPTKGF